MKAAELEEWIDDPQRYHLAVALACTYTAGQRIRDGIGGKHRAILAASVVVDLYRWPKLNAVCSPEWLSLSRAVQLVLNDAADVRFDRQRLLVPLDSPLMWKEVRKFVDEGYQFQDPAQRLVRMTLQDLLNNHTRTDLRFLQQVRPWEHGGVGSMVAPAFDTGPDFLAAYYPDPRHVSHWALTRPVPFPIPVDHPVLDALRAVRSTL